MAKLVLQAVNSRCDGASYLHGNLIDIMDSDKPSFANGYFVDKAIEEAAFILQRIDKNGLNEKLTSV